MWNKANTNLTLSSIWEWTSREIQPDTTTDAENFSNFRKATVA